MIKISFHIINITIILLYIFPGNVPSLTEDNVISINHLLAFFLNGIFGLIAFKKTLSKIIFYLIFLSIFLEILHLLIPNRYFEFRDLVGNLFGILLSYLVIKIVYYYKK